jgi:CubicO group peptidase (beta-lactamase class C family)
LGSVTKAFTALRVKMLIEEGALSEKTPLSHFFPDFPRGDEITIRHLLTHTSGLSEMLRIELFTSNMARPWPPQEIADMVAKQPLDFAPGSAQQYSNSNYLLLGRIIEITTGEPFAKQIQSKIAAPLGMKQLQAGDDNSIVRHEACGYAGGKPDALRKPMLASMIPPMATGNLIGTSEDIVRLVNQGRLLRDNLIDTPPTEPWVLADGRVAQTGAEFLDLSFDQSLLEGMTLFRFRDRPMTLVGKDGMFPGFASWFLYDPQTRTAVAVVTNLETKAMEAMQLAVRVLEAQRRVKAAKQTSK